LPPEEKRSKTKKKGERERGRKGNSRDSCYFILGKKKIRKLGSCLPYPQRRKVGRSGWLCLGKTERKREAAEPKKTTDPSPKREWSNEEGEIDSACFTIDKGKGGGELKNKSLSREREGNGRANVCEATGSVLGKEKKL